MSAQIDLQDSYAGDFAHPAAAEAPQDHNSYQSEANDVPFGQFRDPSLPEIPTDSVISPKEAAIPQPSPQELNFKALREEVDRIKAERELERREHQVQLDMLRANLAQRPQEPSPAARERQMFDGMKDDDIPNVSELRREWQQREQAYQSRLEELEVQSTRPDYAEVIEKFALPLVKQKPHLAEGIQGARNKALFAYELGKMAQQMQSPISATDQVSASAALPTRQEQQAQRIVENARKPGTLSQAGGQGALSKADYFASMSDAEFMKLARSNLEGI